MIWVLVLIYGRFGVFFLVLVGLICCCLIGLGGGVLIREDFVVHGVCSFYFDCCYLGVSFEEAW